MNLLRLSAITLAIFAATTFSLSASVKDLPIKSIDGTSYYYYDVPQKETVYSLCHKLGISKEEIIKHNPSVADGLKYGTTLFFPVDDDSEHLTNKDVTDHNGSRTITHKVEKGQTIYGISTKYGFLLFNRSSSWSDSGSA